MDISITVNFWFLISLCLIFTLFGMLLGGRAGGGGHRDRYRY